MSINQKYKKIKHVGEYYDYVKCNNDIVYIYKNPTGREFDSITSDSDYDLARMFIHSDGNVYAWNGDYLHQDITSKVSGIESPVHATVDSSENDLSIFLAPGISGAKELYSYLKNVNLSMYGLNNDSTLGLNWSYYGADVDPLYYTYSNGEDWTISAFFKVVEESQDSTEQTKISQKSKKHKKLGEYYNYIEEKKDIIYVYKNPTGKEIDEILSESKYKVVRAYLHADGTVYAWNGDYSHEFANKHFPEIDSPVHLEIKENNLIVYITPKISGAKELYSYLKKLNLNMFKLSESSYMDLNLTIGDFFNVNENVEKVSTKIRRLVKNLK